MTPSPSIEEMTKALEGVTPGEWLDARRSAGAHIHANSGEVAWLRAYMGISEDQIDANSRYMVATQPDSMRAFLDQYRTLEGEVERLRAELDNMTAIKDIHAIKRGDHFARAEAAEARVAELEAALEPFSSEEEQWPDDLGDMPFNFDHVRRARTALTKGGSNGG